MAKENRTDAPRSAEPTLPSLEKLVGTPAELDALLSSPVKFKDRHGKEWSLEPKPLGVVRLVEEEIFQLFHEVSGLMPKVGRVVKRDFQKKETEAADIEALRLIVGEGFDKASGRITKILQILFAKEDEVGRPNLKEPPFDQDYVVWYFNVGMISAILGMFMRHLDIGGLLKNLRPLRI